ncbi:hypothetical protein APY06_07155 [Cutibacterium avidum]|nr:hypothetical protein APY06_07140 [Cutibacterium avidum]OIJ78442.1 hypothetical protein APY06_07155 [Cutibacterium avidum]
MRVQAYRHRCPSRAAVMRATSFRRVDSPGADLSANSFRFLSVSLATHSPVAVKPRQPAIAAETATRSTPGTG